MANGRNPESAMDTSVLEALLGGDLVRSGRGIGRKEDVERRAGTGREVGKTALMALMALILPAVLPGGAAYGAGAVANRAGMSAAARGGGAAPTAEVLRNIREAGGMQPWMNIEAGALGTRLGRNWPQRGAGGLSGQSGMSLRDTPLGRPGPTGPHSSSSRHFGGNPGNPPDLRPVASAQPVMPMGRNPNPYQPRTFAGAPGGAPVQVPPAQQMLANMVRQTKLSPEDVAAMTSMVARSVASRNVNLTLPVVGGALGAAYGATRGR